MADTNTNRALFWLEVGGLTSGQAADRPPSAPTVKPLALAVIGDQLWVAGAGNGRLLVFASQWARLKGRLAAGP